ncbi:MAG: PEGA domain-containing protein [Deltaproteobacteria bacterium]|nr:PEGA domain-containing protein [Deltaproteobacteria bacterium]
MEEQQDTARARVWVIVIAALLGIGIGTAVFKLLRAPAPLVATKTVEPKADPPRPAPPPKTLDASGQARADGIKALTEERFDDAIVHFLNSEQLAQGPSDAKELIALARSLRDRREQAAVEAPEPAPPPPPPAPSTRTARRAVRDARPSRPPPAAKEDPTPAKLLVTTQPPGLTIFVDGQARDLTPAKMDLEAGRHQVRIQLGERVLLERQVNLVAGGIESVDADLSREANVAPSAMVDATKVERSPDPTVVPPKPPADPVDVDGRGQLDLVGLIERQALDDKKTPPPVLPPKPKEGGPLLYVFVPSSFGGSRVVTGLKSSLGDVQVRSFGRWKELETQLATEKPDAVLGPGSLLKGSGLPPRLEAQIGSAEVASELVAIGKVPPRAQWTNLTIGTVAEGPRSETETTVAGLLGLDKAPRVRTVAKIDDLLSLLQFKQANLVIVPTAELSRLKSRTRLDLSSQPLVSTPRLLALAVLSESRGNSIESRLADLSSEANAGMGTGKWVKR